MEAGEIVFQGSVGEIEVLVRYPTMDDVELMQDFINQASAEKTFIRLQGEQFSFAQEAQYVDDVLSQLKQNLLVNLLVLSQGKLLAVGDVRRQPYATRHLGRLGIIVHNSARGKGIGRKLMELLIDQTKKQLSGVEAIILSVYRRNDIARQLYSNIGFIEYGCLPNGRKLEDGYDDEIDMYLPLLHPGE